MIRPLVYVLIYFIIGIVFGQQFYEYKFVALFVIINLIISAAISIIHRTNYAVLLTAVSLAGFVLGYYSTLPNDYNTYSLAASGQELNITAEVCELNNKYDNTNQYIVKICAIDEYESKNSKSLLYSSIKLSPGDIINFNSKIKAIPKKANPTDFDSYSYYKSYGIEYEINAEKLKITEHKTNLNSVFMSVRNKIADNYDKILPPKQASFVKAIVLGDKTELDEELYNKLRNSGAAHIIAISGLHITILSGIILLMLGGFSRKISYAVLMTFLLIYSIFTGLSPSVVRACLMCGVLAAGRLAGREYDVVSSASAICILLLIINPFYIRNIGFCYSFLCVFAIGYMGDIILKYDIQNKHFGKYISGFLISFAASIISKPLTAYTFYYINTFDILTNIIIIPALGVLLVLSILSIPASFLSIWFGRFLIGLPYAVINAYEYVCSTMLSLPYFKIQTGGISFALLIGIYILIIIFYLSTVKIRNIIYAFIPITIISLSLAKNPEPINYIDTNNSKTMIITDNDKCILVNCSSMPMSSYGKTRILNYLSFRNIKRIDEIYITQTDYYHSGGVFEIYDDIDIGKIYILNTCDRNDTYYSLLNTAKNKQIETQRITKSHIISKDMSLEDALLLVDNKNVW